MPFYLIFPAKPAFSLTRQNVGSDSVDVSLAEELDRLTRELHNTSNQLQQTQDLHNKSMEELEMLVAKEQEMEERDVRGQESRVELERELDAKDELVSCCLVAYLSFYHEEAITALIRARLGVAGHRSATPRWGNPAKCSSQRHNK